MQADISEARRWALEEFGNVELGHGSRRTRLVRMATQVAVRPGGKVSEVFTGAADAEGAYRWLENSAVRVEALVEGIADVATQLLQADATIIVGVGPHREIRS